MTAGAVAGALVDEAAVRLSAAGIEPARHEAVLLLAAASGLSGSVLRADPRRPIPADAVRRFRDLVERRCARVPLQHLLGRWPFLDFELRVDRRALIPRFETEQLALWAIAVAREERAERIADIGTGCGCLAIALARGCPGARVVALDACTAALELARENVGGHRLERRIALVRGSLVASLAGGSFDLLVANLPYVDPADVEHLEPEVREHEPRAALVAADGGFALVARLVEQAPRVLRPGGRLLLEFDPRQADRLRERLAAGSWHDVRLREDATGRIRMACARRRADGAPGKKGADR